MKNIRFNLTGNERIKKYLTTAVNAGTLSHAYIVEGARGSGRHTLVKQLMQVMACERNDVPCGVCAPCMKIASGCCVDIQTITKAEGKTSLTVDRVRTISDTVAMAPNDLEFRAYIIDGADDMNVNAQNSLLKMLEEPPQNVFFFLITENASGLLPTVRSRAIVLHTERLTDSQVLGILKSKGIAESAKVREAVRIADGSAGKALELVSGTDGLPEYRRAASQLCAMLFSTGKERSDKPSFIAASMKYIKKTEDFKAIYSLLLRAVRDISVARRGIDVPMCFFTERETAENYSAAVTGNALSALADTITDYLNNADTPTGTAVTVTEYSNRLWQALRA